MVDIKESSHLKLPEFRFWYNAILENDISKLQDILQKSTKLQRNKLLNEPFDFDPMDSNQLSLTKQISSRFQITYPLQLVAILGYKESFNILVDNGANIFTKDAYGNNILHLMCYIANANNEEEEKLRAFYKHLLEKFPKDDMKLLLICKNNLEWNPEVTAVSLGVLGIFLDIFMSKGMTKY